MSQAASMSFSSRMGTIGQDSWEPGCERIECRRQIQARFIVGTERGRRYGKSLLDRPLGKELPQTNALSINPI
jgi:hypothetical protein